MENEKIWCVFNPNGRAPFYVHRSAESAKQEAKRLARIHPETPFYVMESIGLAKKVDVEYYAYEKGDYAPAFREEELPF